MREALAVELARFPKEQRLTLTWERGKEMAEYQQLAEMTGIDIYFGDPSSPWQRGTNENTNRLLRQYLPKKSNLAQHSQTDLDKLAAKLKNWPRKVLGWKTPNEAYAEALGALTA